MLISLGNLGKPFLTWKTHIYKKKGYRTIAIPKNHIQELHDNKM